MKMNPDLTPWNCSSSWLRFEPFLPFRPLSPFNFFEVQRQDRGEVDFHPYHTKVKKLLKFY
jgi:hypothetical protein